MTAAARLDMAPFRRLLLARIAQLGDAEMAEVLGYTLQGQRMLLARETITEWKADELCATLGLHPSEVWGREWYDVVAIPDDEDDMTSDNKPDDPRCANCPLSRVVEVRMTKKTSAVQISNHRRECRANPPTEAGWPGVPDDGWCTSHPGVQATGPLEWALLDAARELRWSTRLRNQAQLACETRELPLTLGALLGIENLRDDRGFGERTHDELRESVRSIGVEYRG